MLRVIRRVRSYLARWLSGAQIMSLTGLEVFDDTVHKTNSWLKQIGQQLNIDRRHSYQALRAVLHSLRDRLSVQEAADLSDQLPMLVRGIFFEGWRPADVPVRIRSREEFLALIAMQFPPSQPVDAEQAANAVFQVLEDHVTAGEIRDVLQNLPQDIRTLWPHHERYAA
jgi:uncharacterized protein (DUF2267 family)